MEDYEHSYPHCWRCGTPLLYYAKPSWYIATSKLRDELLAANETVDWHPPRVKHGRFGDWLKNNVDWALSRERYWGTPLPVWRCASGHVHVIGSYAELAERSGERARGPPPPVRRRARVPVPPRRARTGRACGRATMRRVPEVIDVWFDSGAMPFAQHHHPFEHEDRFERALPRGLHLRGAGPDARLVLLAAGGLDAAGRAPAPRTGTSSASGLILDEDGQKMSKSKGNAVEPWQVLDTYGADAFRWYFFTSKQPWDGYRFSAETIGEGVRLFLKQLWSHLLLLRRSTRRRPSAEPAAPASAPTATTGADDDLDRWALSRTAGTAAAGGRAAGRLRRDLRRAGDRGAGRRAVELVRAPLAPALLGRRPGGVSRRCARAC